MNEKNDLAIFSHEINNSLTLIYSQLQYIEKKNIHLKTDESWIKMNEDFLTLFDTIRQMLSPSDDALATMEPQDLVSIFKEVKASWSYRLRRGHIDFNIQPSTKEPFYVYGPKSKLLQMFHNLISNAVKALQQKKETSWSPRISVLLSKEQGHIVLSVSDNGIGMTCEQQSRAFYRGVSFLPCGNGIGLSVVNEIAKELNIKIHMDSAPNQGTTFTLIFPARGV